MISDIPTSDLQLELANRLPLAHIATVELEKELDRRLRKPRLFPLQQLMGLGITSQELKRAEVVVKVCADSADITPDQLLSKSRAQVVALPRQIAMKICRDLGMGSKRIADIFDKGDHTTVLHAERVVTSKAKESAQFQAALNSIANRVAGILAKQS